MSNDSYRTYDVKRALKGFGFSKTRQRVVRGTAHVTGEANIDVVLANLDSLLDQGLDVTIDVFESSRFVTIHALRETSGGRAITYDRRNGQYPDREHTTVYRTKRGVACSVTLVRTRWALAEYSRRRAWAAQRAENVRSGNKSVYRNRNGHQAFYTPGGYISVTQLFEGLVQPAVVGLPLAGLSRTDGAGRPAVYVDTDLDPATGRGYFDFTPVDETIPLAIYPSFPEGLQGAVQNYLLDVIDATKPQVDSFPYDHVDFDPRDLAALIKEHGTNLAVINRDDLERILAAVPEEAQADLKDIFYSPLKLIF